MQSPHGPEGVRADGQRYIDVVAPGLLDDPGQYQGRVFLEVQDESEKGWGWTHAKGLPEDGPRSWALEHLGGGAGVSLDWWGERPVNAVGMSLPPDARTEFVWLDLDGGYSLGEFMKAWHAKFRGDRYHLLTPGSGRAGRYRLCFRLCEPLEVRKVRPTVEALLRELGFPARAGYVEIFPDHRRQTRLPFGNGGCVRFGPVHGDKTPRATPTHPLKLLKAIQKLKPVNLAGYVQGPRPKPKRRRVADSERRKEEGCLPSATRALIRRGADVGHRREAIRELTVGCHRAGMQRDRAAAFIRKLADHVLGKTRGWFKAKDQAATLAEIGRVVDAYYDKYKQALPSPEHLTRQDVAELAKRAESAATAEMSAAHILAFHLRVLPLVRAAYRAGYHPVKDEVIDATRTQLRIHCDDFRAAALGSGVPYTQLRDSLGLFVDAGLGYLPETRAKRPGDARCKTWICGFQFDPGESPRRPVVGDARRKRAAFTLARAFERIVGAFADPKCGGLNDHNHSQKDGFKSTRRQSRPVLSGFRLFSARCRQGFTRAEWDTVTFQVARVRIWLCQQRALSPPDAENRLSRPEPYSKSPGTALVRSDVAPGVCRPEQKPDTPREPCSESEGVQLGRGRDFSEAPILAWCVRRLHDGARVGALTAVQARGALVRWVRAAVGLKTRQRREERD